MGAPFGNRNAVRALEWRQALLRALKTYEDDEVKRGTALHHIARVIVKKALSGEMDAVQEIACRLDGKPLQNVESRLSAQLTYSPATESHAETDRWLTQFAIENRVGTAPEVPSAEILRVDVLPVTPSNSEHDNAR